ncbi:hypothetical protein [Sphingobium sp. R-21]|uniref:hypothetical protein n=1 Tax=Sphingobium sp. R-21 TaxID=3404056 RepID=UPI003CF3A353
MPEVRLDEEIRGRSDPKSDPPLIEIASNNSVSAKRALNVSYTPPHNPVLRGVQMMQRWSDYLDELRDGGKILRPSFPAARRAS